MNKYVEEHPFSVVSAPDLPLWERAVQIRNDLSIALGLARVAIRAEGPDSEDNLFVTVDPNAGMSTLQQREFLEDMRQAAANLRPKRADQR